MIRIYHENTEITEFVVGLEISLDFCSSVGTLSLLVAGEYQPISAAVIYDKIKIYLNDELYKTFLVSSITRRDPEFTYVLECVDGSKLLLDYFLGNLRVPSPGETTKSALIKIFQEAKVNYQFDVSGAGMLLSEYSPIGLKTAYDEVFGLLQISGWYLKFDKDNKAIIYRPPRNAPAKATFDDSAILEIEVIRDSSPLRNRAVVWGGPDIYGGGYVYGEYKITAPWQIDEKDLRTMILSNPKIPTHATARAIARALVSDFKDEIPIIILKVPGVYYFYPGDQIQINSNLFTGKANISNIEIQGSADGVVTTLILNERCVRRAIPVFSGDPYVYIGTAGSGVWRKLIDGFMWENFSQGMGNEDVTDLFVYRRALGAVTSGGKAYLRMEFDPFWKKATLPSGYSARAVTADHETNQIIFLTDDSDLDNSPLLTSMRVRAFGSGVKVVLNSPPELWPPVVKDVVFDWESFNLTQASLFGVDIEDNWNGELFISVGYGEKIAGISFTFSPNWYPDFDNRFTNTNKILATFGWTLSRARPASFVDSRMRRVFLLTMGGLTPELFGIRTTFSPEPAEDFSRIISYFQWNSVDPAGYYNTPLAFQYISGRFPNEPFQFILLYRSSDTKSIRTYKVVAGVHQPIILETFSAPNTIYFIGQTERKAYLYFLEQHIYPEKRHRGYRTIIHGVEVDKFTGAIKVEKLFDTMPEEGGLGIPERPLWIGTKPSATLFYKEDVGIPLKDVGFIIKANAYGADLSRLPSGNIRIDTILCQAIQIEYYPGNFEVKTELFSRPLGFVTPDTDYGDAFFYVGDNTEGKERIYNTFYIHRDFGVSAPFVSEYFYPSFYDYPYKWDSNPFPFSLSPIPTFTGKHHPSKTFFITTINGYKQFGIINLEDKSDYVLFDPQGYRILAMCSPTDKRGNFIAFAQRLSDDKFGFLRLGISGEVLGFVETTISVNPAQVDNTGIFYAGGAWFHLWTLFNEPVYYLYFGDSYSTPPGGNYYPYEYEIENYRFAAFKVPSSGMSFVLSSGNMVARSQWPIKIDAASPNPTYLLNQWVEVPFDYYCFDC